MNDSSSTSMQTATARPVAPPSRRPRLRYVDLFLDAYDDEASDCAAALGRHLHWGFHANPSTRIEAAEEFARAGDAMSALVIDAAKLTDGASVLDAGCGFGGTLRQLSEQDLELKLTGLNIDPRQIHRARSQQVSVDESGVHIGHTCGDATEMPFADESFDAVLALELTCHFEERAPFFAEARRVLRPGGRLVVADYASSGPVKPLAAAVDFCLGPLFTRVYGRLNCKLTFNDYRRLTEAHGFEVARKEDLTRNTLPNFRFLRRLMGNFEISFWEKRFNDVVSLTMENAARMGALKYFLMTFVRK
ncbi:MAG: SAM-dependent methyltransferase [Candidatus Binatia bacterium]|jgi:SAM-dependent methyltransferase